MLGIVLDRSLSRSLGSQLSDQLRARILSGELGGGARLPSSRELSRELGISRTLVLEAFEQLEAEGYVEGIRGAGSYVRAGAAVAAAATAGAISGGAFQTDIWKREREGETFIKGVPPRSMPKLRNATPVDFRPGVPALDQFPREAWARALAEAARRLPAAALGYGEGAGMRSLREETAAYLYRSKGLRAAPDEVFITAGCSQALGLVSRALLRGAGRAGSSQARYGRAVLENPCQPALSGLLAREGVELVAGRVDAEGLDPRSLPRDRPAVAFVTPSHQYPLGPVLSAPRRAALVEWARSTDSVIVEDDFDGEFRYGGPPLGPLRELDPSRVVYAGSFSKSFSPGLRLGYAIVPPALREAWSRCRELTDIHSCAFTQAAMASFLASGAFERHVRRMRRLYAARRAALLGAIGKAFGPGGALEVMGEAAGLNLALRFPETCFREARSGAGAGRVGASGFDEALVSRIASAGAIVYPASRYAFSPVPELERVLLLGYGNLAAAEMTHGLAAIAASI